MTVEIKLIDEGGKVNSVHPYYRTMEARREMLRDLMGGTYDVRAAGEKYLPKNEKEHDDDWAVRLRGATLTPFFRNAMHSMLSKPFEKPLTLDQDLTHSKIFEYYDNIDLSGTNLHDMGYVYGLESTVSGVSFLVTDFQNNQAIGATLQQQKDMLLRPYIFHVKPHNVFGWRTEKVGGVSKLTQFRYFTVVEKPEGDFGVQYVPVIRVLEPGKWQEWEFRGTNGWVFAAEGEVRGFDNRPLNVIPVTPYYTNQCGTLKALPPHEDIGYANIKYYQSRSEQDTSLHFARIPMYFGKNLNVSVPGQEKSEPGIDISSHNIILGGADSDLKVVEHTGQAIEAGRVDLKDLSDEIAAMTVAAHYAKPGNMTATAKAIDESNKNTVVKARTRNLEAALNQALDYMALFDRELAAFKEANEHVASVNLNTDYGLSMAAESDIQDLIKMRQMGEISSPRFLTEVQRRGLLSDDLDIEDEVDSAESDVPETPSEPLDI